MCTFFSFCTCPSFHPGKRFYFNWKQRNSKESAYQDIYCDSHDHIIHHYKLDDAVVNKYEYNPFTKRLIADTINSSINDIAQVRDWAEKFDFKRIVKPLIKTDVINPFDLPTADANMIAVDLLNKFIHLIESDDINIAAIAARSAIQIKHHVCTNLFYKLKSLSSCAYDIKTPIIHSLFEHYGARYINESKYGKISRFIDLIDYLYFISLFDLDILKYLDIRCIKYVEELWNMGIVISYDGDKYRLHSDHNAKIIYETKKGYSNV
jgi:hypothetical protein